MTAGPLDVSDAALQPERIQYFVKELSNSKHRLLVFKAAYAGKRKAPLTPKYLAEKTKLSVKRATEVATDLANRKMLHRVQGGRAIYERIPSLIAHKTKIARLACSPRAAAKQVTIRTPRHNNSIIRTVRIPSPKKAIVVHVFIDDISEFAAVKKIHKSNITLSLVPLAETKFKTALNSLLPGTDLFKDWGGERNDLFGQHLTLKGKRVTVAFALKGPFARPPLNPGKMGKNGDQIQRLVFQAPAKLFVIQYEGAIDVSVYEQLEQLVRAKASLLGEKLYYCIIDHMDSTRLRLAYPKAFA